jgi:PAS domain S-box-containing protein
MKNERDAREQSVDRVSEIQTSNCALKASNTEPDFCMEYLGESEQRFRSVAQSAVDAIISTDATDAVVFWNQGATRVFGYSEDEVLGKSVTMIIPEPYRDAHRKGLGNYLETGRPALIGSTAELEGLRKNGERFPLELSLSAWTTRAGTFFTGIIRDISVRKEMERALEQRTEELESLIQMVAHDLKSPVITVGGLTRRLKKCAGELPQDGKIDQILNQLVSATRTMEEFLADLLDGLALEHSKPERTSVNMDQLVREVVQRLEQTIRERCIELRLEIAAPLPAVSGDRRRIAQVLDNLLVNAVRYMGQRPDPTVSIQVMKDGDAILTRVCDNGVGIPDELQGKIFERFYRVRRSDSPAGTGLGLAISQKIVESHGGKIWVESREGQGATFSFTLPVPQKALKI